MDDPRPVPPRDDGPRFDTPVEVLVWGEFACFTRPEMKVERVSYPVMTPSAARGVLEAIYWKPEFRWEVREIAVLRDVAFASFTRNEVKGRASERAARGWGPTGGYSAPDERTQRHTLALRDVAYVVRAVPRPHAGGADAEAKHRDTFRRRVQRGQCFTPPYLGCREWAAGFAPPVGDERPIDVSGPLGRMLLGMDYAADGSGRADPVFFEAELDRGVLRVPSWSGSARGGG